MLPGEIGSDPEAGSAQGVESSSLAYSSGPHDKERGCFHPLGVIASEKASVSFALLICFPSDSENVSCCRIIERESP